MRLPWWWNNFITTPQRWAAYWLRRRGWVVFYLDDCNRECRGLCWLALYEEGERRARCGERSDW